MADPKPYHHGNLRQALIDAAVGVIAQGGAVGLRLREVSRVVGVSHTAAAHHFGDKAGLLTAVASEGFMVLSDALALAGDDCVEVGLAYVRFATTHPGHFAVMFRPDLLHAEDPEFLRARGRAGTALRAGHGRPGEGVAGLAAWSLVHGLATLWISGAVSPPDDAEQVVRAVVQQLRPW
jgi:AcrR family transcriptional regulator